MRKLYGYKRKTDRGKRSTYDMFEVVKKVRNNESSIDRPQIDRYHVPKSTLERRVTKCERTLKYLERFRQIFSDEQEQEIVEYILKTKNRFLLT